MEQENQQLKMANVKQTEQIMLLQDKLQGDNQQKLLGLTIVKYCINLILCKVASSASD